MNINNYHPNTTVAELLRDDDFISSMLDPSPESEQFWQQLLQNEQLPEAVYAEARAILLAEPEPMDAQVKADLFDRIQSAGQKKRQPWPLMRYAAAAAVILTLGISLLLFWQKEQASTSPTLANKTLADSTGIRLVSGTGETLNIAGKEAVLDFSNATAVTVNKEKIAMKSSQEAIMHEVHVPVGKRISLILEDGTKLWVNAGSSIKFPSHFNSNKREVQVDGEVYADVVKDPTKPFVFHTKQFDVQVLGTSLNIHAYAQEKKQQVTLVEGKVKVKTADAEHFLNPDQAFLNNGQSEQVKNVDVSFYVSWKDGFYRFKDQPIKEVINNLERFYGVAIVCEPKIANLKCSGYLDMKDNLQDVLKGVAFSMDIQLKKEENTYKLYQ